MSGDLGNKTCTDLLLIPSALSPPNSILIESANFDTILVPKNGVFKAFADISGKSSRKKVTLFHIFFLHMHWCGRVTDSNFCSLICSGSRGTTLGTFLRYMTGPARRCYEFNALAKWLITYNIPGIQYISV